MCKVLRQESWHSEGASGASLAAVWTSEWVGEDGPRKVRQVSLERTLESMLRGLHYPLAMGSHWRFQKMGPKPISDLARIWKAILTAVVGVAEAAETV